LGSFGLSSVVFGDPSAALGAFGRPLRLHLSLLGVHWSASGASLCSICRLWGSIGCSWGSLRITFGVTLRLLWSQSFILHEFEDLYSFGDLFKEKRAMKRPKCENVSVFVRPNGDSEKNTFFPQTRDIDRVCIFACLKPCFCSFCNLFKERCAVKRPNCELDPIFVAANGGH